MADFSHNGATINRGFLRDDKMDLIRHLLAEANRPPQGGDLVNIKCADSDWDLSFELSLIGHSDDFRKTFLITDGDGDQRFRGAGVVE